MMKILVDAHGGDQSMNEIVDACLLFLYKNKNVKIDIVGKQSEIEAALKCQTF